VTLAGPEEAGLAGRRLYLCTPDRPDLEQFVAACVRGGVDILQLRDKHLDARHLVKRARMLRALCADMGVPFILNDRPDLALEIGADGVHVGQDDASAELARRILGDDALVGLSTHRTEELDASRTAPVDYISAGPVVPTPTKPGRPGTGTAYVRAAVARAGRPVFVTGGVTPETVDTLARSGASHFVVVRFLTDSPDPEADARRLRASIDHALERRASHASP
jgi:thiamine-phosphate pyrophosphorylase